MTRSNAFSSRWMEPRVPCARHYSARKMFSSIARDARYDGSALVTAFQPGAFALLPVIIDGKVAGCLYADVPRAPSEFDAVRPALSRARDVITAAIRKKAPPSGATNA